MSSINRRRTYLNYLFENMTFIEKIRYSNTNAGGLAEYIVSQSSVYPFYHSFLLIFQESSAYDFTAKNSTSPKIILTGKNEIISTNYQGVSEYIGHNSGYNGYGLTVSVKDYGVVINIPEGHKDDLRSLWVNNLIVIGINE